jgi:predicted metal-dependent phosphoesterase TrpH
MQKDKFVDLHVHTTASDGTYSAEAVLIYASELGLKAIAITDHDTMEGYITAPSNIIEVIPGIELTVDYLGREIHLLGYFINPDKLSVTQMAVQDRERRNRLIIDTMKADGFDLSLEDLLEEKKFGVLGRPHIAAELVRKGYAATVKEAFDRWLGEGAKYYVPRRYLSVEEGCKAIREADGVPVLAHPLQYGFSDEGLRLLIGGAKEAGCKGLEAIYPEYSKDDVDYLCALASKFSLSVTGGSDFHGENRPECPLGCVKVPYSLLEELKKQQ